ncbi:hypothetical protein ACIPZ5_17810 [Pseudomonas sp. NPDC089428]|uniref:hypothetical protein n=1 Tax=Pseudomonas sp. NPDC089428 TaxID=3364467 RepID=UPI00380B8C8D
MDGVQVTTIVSLVGGVVGIIALSVAYAQMRIASAKTKLDLYNKRFSVYLAALEFKRCAGTMTRDGIQEKFEKLVQAYRESLFLFDAKDGIRETMEKIQKAGWAILVHHNAKTDPKSADAMLEKFQGSAFDAYTNLTDDLLALEEQLKRYLSFHNVRGWTIF